VSASRKGLLLCRALTQVFPSPASQTLPALAATRFLVDATASPGLPNAVARAGRRSVADRLVWTAELFARLEQRDRMRVASGSSQPRWS
jgi:hypothetical protein